MKNNKIELLGKIIRQLTREQIRELISDLWDDEAGCLALDHIHEFMSEGVDIGGTPKTCMPSKPDGSLRDPTLKEFARITQRSEKTIRRYISDGMPVKQCGTSYEISIEDAQNWIAKNKQGYTKCEPLENSFKDNPNKLIDYLAALIENLNPFHKRRIKSLSAKL